MTISIIVAIADNGAIGKGNKLLWHISEDLRYFKKVTTGYPVIMGRKTWESLGRPLPGRRNIVISRSLKSLSGAEVFSSLEESLEVLKDFNGEIFIIGGGEIYRQALPIAQKLYLTRVHITAADADTFFPAISPDEWIEIANEYHKKGEHFEHSFEFTVFERRKAIFKTLP